MTARASIDAADRRQCEIFGHTRELERAGVEPQGDHDAAEPGAGAGCEAMFGSINSIGTCQITSPDPHTATKMNADQGGAAIVHAQHANARHRDANQPFDEVKVEAPVADEQHAARR